MRSSRQGCSAADGSIAPQSSVSCSEVPSSILPLELWRVIFLYLPLRDLCHCAQVCSEWYLLVSSLDSTVWKRFFLQSIEWQHPLWPKMDSGEALKPWRHLYREHFHATRAWAKIKDRPNTTSCINIFQRKRESKIIRVGPLCEHESLKSALSVAGEYDKILIAPGVYDEQFEMFSKIPFELIGQGKLGTVMLVMCVEQNAITGRLCNLTLKAPWFTSHVIKVKQGHLQMDNCAIEEGIVSVEHPASCHFRYCRFRKAQMVLSHVSMSIVENCEFTNLDGAAITVEGFPKDSSNWAHEHMYKMSDTWGLRSGSKARGFSLAEEFSTSCASALQNRSCDTLSTLSHLKGRSQQGSLCHKPDDMDSIGEASIAGSQPSLAETANTYDASSFSSSFTEPGRSQFKEHLWNSEETSAALAAAQATLDCQSSSSSSGGLSAIHMDGPHALLTSLWSADTGGPEEIENILRFSFEASLETDEGLREAISQIKGCVIRHCKIHDCHGGLAVSQQGQARLEKCEFSEMLFGVRCVQNAKTSMSPWNIPQVAVLGNSIHHCFTSGIFFRSAAHGLIAGNDIYCTNEAGIDIRKSADPLVQCNQLHHSKRSGIVVLGGGCGTIKSNDIYQNREAGIYILYKGNPYVTGNRIVHGGAAGIAINEEGRGCIVDNVISANRWGGIDIRRGSDPQVSHNYVCNGLADGIVIGQNGRGTIEANTVKGNVGCGIWVMGGQPLIQLNQIYNNNDTGVSFIQTRDADEDLSTDGGETDSIASSSSPTLVDFEGETSDSSGNDTTSHEDDPPQPRLKYNTIYHNNGFGVLAQCNEQILMSGNAVHANHNTGVYIKQLLPVSIISNSITCNSGTGLHVSADAKAKVEGNGIYDNKGHGVLVQGEATICSNDIFSNQQCALSIEASADCKVESNRIHAPDDLALLMQNGVKAVVKRNSFYHGNAQLWNKDIVNESKLSEENVILEHKDAEQPEGEDSAKKSIPGKTDWHLENPPARPHIEAPPTLVPHMPVRSINMVTRVIVPPGGGCQQFSQICIIL